MVACRPTPEQLDAYTEVLFYLGELIRMNQGTGRIHWRTFAVLTVDEGPTAHWALARER